MNTQCIFKISETMRCPNMAVPDKRYCAEHLQIVTDADYHKICRTIKKQLDCSKLDISSVDPKTIVDLMIKYGKATDNVMNCFSARQHFTETYVHDDSQDLGHDWQISNLSKQHSQCYRNLKSLNLMNEQMIKNIEIAKQNKMKEFQQISEDIKHLDQKSQNLELLKQSTDETNKILKKVKKNEIIRQDILAQIEENLLICYQDGFVYILFIVLDQIVPSKYYAEYDKKLEKKANILPEIETLFISEFMNSIASFQTDKLRTILNLCNIFYKFTDTENSKNLNLKLQMKRNSLKNELISLLDAQSNAKSNLLNFKVVALSREILGFNSVNQAYKNYVHKIASLAYIVDTQRQFYLNEMYITTFSVLKDYTVNNCTKFLTASFDSAWTYIYQLEFFVGSETERNQLAQRIDGLQSELFEKLQTILPKKERINVVELKKTNLAKIA